MRIRKAHLPLLAAIIFAIIFVSIIGPSGIVSASELVQIRPPAGPGTGTPVPNGFCGDGVCDYYRGELAGRISGPWGTAQPACPIDCDTPTPTATKTRTPTPTQTVTPTITTTPTATNTPDGTATATPEFNIFEFDPNAAGGLIDGCEAIAFSEMSEEAQAFYRSEMTSDFEPSDDLIVLLCEVEIEQDVVCFQLTDTLLDAVSNDPNRIGLLYCDVATGLCQVMPDRGQVSGGRICYDIASVEDFTCSGGCVLIPLDRVLSEGNTINIFGTEINQTILLISAIGVLVVGGVSVAIFVLGGRKPPPGVLLDEDEEDA